MHAHLPLSLGPSPNSALPAWQLAVMAVVVVLALAAWLILVYAADRRQRHQSAARTTPAPPQLPARGQEHGQPEHKAA